MSPYRSPSPPYAFAIKMAALLLFATSHIYFAVASDPHAEPATGAAVAAEVFAPYAAVDVRRGGLYR